MPALSSPDAQWDIRRTLLDEMMTLRMRLGGSMHNLWNLRLHQDTDILLL